MFSKNIFRFVCLKPTFVFFMTVCVYFHREQVQRSEEPPPPSGAGHRHQSMKHSSSQHSFDSAILEGSLPDENLSVDSDASDNFVVLMDSGN